MKVFLGAVFWVMFLAGAAVAAETEVSESGLSLPRMASLRSDHINGRSGPETKYPIEWVYRHKGAPVEIVNEFGLWRKIKDWDGAESWVHKSMLSGKRTVRVMTPGENNIYNDDDFQSRVVAKVEDGVFGDVLKCKKGNAFCLVKFDTIEGYMPRSVLFGVMADEVIK